LSPVTDDSQKSHPWHLHDQQARVNVTGHGWLSEELSMAPSQRASTRQCCRSRMTLGRVIHGTMTKSKHASMLPVTDDSRKSHPWHLHKEQARVNVTGHGWLSEESSMAPSWPASTRRCCRSRMTLGRVIHGTFGTLCGGRLLPVTTSPEEQTLRGGRLSPVTDDSQKSHPWHLHDQQARVNVTGHGWLSEESSMAPSWPASTRQCYRSRMTLRRVIHGTFTKSKHASMLPVTDDSQKSHPWHLHDQQARVNATGHGW